MHRALRTLNVNKKNLTAALSKSTWISEKHFSAQAKLKENDVTEIKIPVPWGHIAGKWWGDKNKVPLLALHGWQDNANSFDKLVPLLNVSSFLAIDLPGHGHSSYYPPGKLYNFVEYMFTIRQVVDHFKWSQCALFGHSFGSALNYAYASIYPEEVSYLASSECGRSLIVLYTIDLPHNYANGIERVLKTEKCVEGKPPPTYSKEEILKLLIKGSMGSLASLESVNTLFTRATVKKPITEKTEVAEVTEPKDLTDLQRYFTVWTKKSTESEKKQLAALQKKLSENIQSVMEEVKSSTAEQGKDYVYSFTRDPRIKVNTFGVFNKEVLIHCVKHIKCPIVTIRAKDGFLVGPALQLFKEMNEISKKRSDYFEYHEVDGFHHTHMDNPEQVATIFNSFLKSIEV